MVSRSTQLGNEGEAMAAAHLQAKGYQILLRQYKCKPGEIDIVAQKDDVLVFVEVKNHSEASYYDALDALTPSKIKKLLRAAEHYLWENHVEDDMQVRFDVVAIDRKAGQAPRIQHIEDAFERDS